MAGRRSAKGAWWLFAAGSAGAMLLLAVALTGMRQSLFLSGPLSAGHHQIAAQCEACHVSPFGGAGLIQDACVDCHEAQLKRVDDSHPRSKFLDPRNAALLEKVDARYCVTCHVEHEPRRTRAMGVTLPGDFCSFCHRDIGRERPSHAGLDFASCATAGCHNFHDNRYLHADFLVRHLDEARLLAQPLPAPALTRAATAAALDAAGQDGGRHASPETVAAWAKSAHAAGGVNCRDCHVPESGRWVAKPGRAVCADCHARQVGDFGKGMHGMRLAAGLAAMRPELARLPMHPEAAGKTLTCNRCHAAHAYDTRHAAAEACLGCHADRHSLAWKDSPHARPAAGAAAAERPVADCAACHMPRRQDRVQGVREVFVQHNQSANLQPVEAMLEGVCLRCHGTGFALDALADAALVERNFNGSPDVHVESLDWVRNKRDSAGNDTERNAH